MSKNTASGTTYKVLIADNDEGHCKVVAQGLTAQKFKVEYAKNWESALYLFNQNLFNICILDLNFHEMPATVLIQKWRKHEMIVKRNPTFIVCSGGEKKANDQALIAELGDVAYLAKPFQIPQLLSIIAKASNQNAVRTKFEEVKTKVNSLLENDRSEKALQMAKEQYSTLEKRGQFELAQVLERVSQNEEAEKILSNLISAEPNNISYLNAMARVKMAEGKFAEAKVLYEKIDAQAPNNIERMNEMVQLYLSLKMPKESVAKMKDIMKVNPDQPDLKFNFYETLDKAGFGEEARKFCSETSTPKEMVKYYNNKGVLNSKTGEHAGAISEYTLALKLAPNAKEMYKIYYNLAISHINLKTQDNLVLAEEFLLKCLEKSPDYDKAKEKLEIVRKYLRTE